MFGFLKASHPASFCLVTQGLDKEWSTLAALVTHHTVMREMLPCTLRLPKVKASATTGNAPAASSASSSPSHAPSSMSSPPPGGHQDARYTKTKTVTRTIINGREGHDSGVSKTTTTAVCSSSVVNTRQQFLLGGAGGMGGGPSGGGFREREAGVMYTDNYSYLSEMADFVDQLKM